MQILTLAEYLSQENPTSNRLVKLNVGEYEIIDRFILRFNTLTPEPCTVVKIHAYPDYQYIQRGQSLCLRTYSDGHNQESCFYLPESLNYVEWFVSEDHKRLFCTFKELSSLAGVPLVHNYSLKGRRGSSVLHEYKVTNETDKINTDGLFKAGY
jgi:hypothetical protein